MIKELTSLRFVFFFIFLSHIPLSISGVSMATSFFFVLGGFGLTLGYHDKSQNPNFSYKQYITRRLWKFYPLHWLCLLATLPLVLTSFQWKELPIFFLKASLLQTWFPVQGIYFSFNSVSWYLANTMFFAVIFPILHRYIDRYRISSALCVTLFYVLLIVLIPSDYRPYGLYINPLSRMVDFVVGIYTAFAFLSIRDKSWGSRFVSRGNLVVLGIAIIFLCAIYIPGVKNMPESIWLFSLVYWGLLL